MIEATVTLPLFRAHYIAWLALESLCRQQDITFEWELVIAEELNDETFGIDRIKDYRKRLQDVGCVRLEYIPLDNWISLGIKHKMIAEHTSPSSGLFFKSAADIYSAPQRLQRIYDLWKEHPEGDWFIPVTAINYDIKTGQAIVRDPAKMLLPGTRVNDIAGLAIRGELFREAITSFGSSVNQAIRMTDTEAWNFCNSAKGDDLIVIRELSDMWRYGLNTTGLNNISDRTHLFIQPNKNPLIIPYPYDLSETIPHDILDRLKECVKLLPLHKKQVPPE